MTTDRNQEKNASQSEARVLKPKPAYDAATWRPERSSLTRREFRRIVREVMG